MTTPLPQIIALLVLMAIGVGLYAAWKKELLPGWVVAFGGILLALGTTAGALLLRRSVAKAALPPEPPPAPPSREVVTTATTIVHERAERERAVITAAGIDVDRLADIGRGQQ